jgi:hypothetical protein
MAHGKSRAHPLHRGGPDEAPHASPRPSLPPSRQSEEVRHEDTREAEEQAIVATSTAGAVTGHEHSLPASKPPSQNYANMVVRRHLVLESRQRLLEPCATDNSDEHETSTTTCAPGNPSPTGRAWPEHREARGFLSLSHIAIEERGSRTALFSIHRRTLTVSMEARTGAREGVDMIVAQASVDQLVITVFQGRFDMFRLCLKGEESENIYCFATDQTARNKWIAIFRRMSITIQAQWPASVCVDTNEQF